MEMVSPPTIILIIRIIIKPINKSVVLWQRSSLGMGSLLAKLCTGRVNTKVCKYKNLSRLFPNESLWRKMV